MTDQVVSDWAITTPASDGDIRRNVQHALSLGLLELAWELPSTDRVNIVANGPSGSGAPLAGSSIAVNGGLGLFTREGQSPTFWLTVDPQELVADLFLKDPPKDTVYLIASKCHPAVFDALKGRMVMIFHVGEAAVGDLVIERENIFKLATSTLSAFEVARLMGYGGFDVYGWDGCLFGQRRHAVAQHDPKDIVLCTIDGVTFPTTTAWMYEAQTAVGYFKRCPISDLVIHGDGMIAAQLRFQGLLPQRPAEAA